MSNVGLSQDSWGAHADNGPVPLSALALLEFDVNSAQLLRSV